MTLSLAWLQAWLSVSLHGEMSGDGTAPSVLGRDADTTTEPLATTCYRHGFATNPRLR